MSSPPVSDLPRRRMRVPALPGAAPVRLPAAAAHHVVHVLRLRVGARLLVFDGAGHQQVVELQEIDDQGVLACPVSEALVARPERESALLLALLKPKALDVAVRMATETGVTAITVWRAARSVQRPPRVDRWERIAQAAAQQCGRADLPALRAADGLDGALDAAQSAGHRLLVALPGAARPDRQQGRMAAIVGPEGGLTEQEVDVCLQAGATPLGLGAWTLRADTAAALAAAFVAG